jgi:hypothetical protein
MQIAIRVKAEESSAFGIAEKLSFTRSDFVIRSDSAIIREPKPSGRRHFARSGGLDAFAMHAAVIGWCDAAEREANHN